MGTATLLRVHEYGSMLNLQWHDSPGALNSKLFLALHRSKSYLVLITSASIPNFIKCERYHPASDVQKRLATRLVFTVTVCTSYFHHFSTLQVTKFVFQLKSRMKFVYESCRFRIMYA